MSIARRMGHTENLREFIDEVDAHCATESIGPSTLTNRVLGQTYALPRMLALAESLDSRIDRLRAAMGSGARSNVAILPPTSNLRRSITFDLPVPPSTNKLHKSDPTGQRYRGQAHATWKKVAAQQIMIDRAGWAKEALPFDQPYVARIRIAASDRAVKALLDLLVEMQVTPDDKHLLHVSAGRSRAVDPARCIITVRSVPIRN